jgi:hypothetical protein
MRSLLLVGMCVVLSGCLGFGRKDKAEAPPPPPVVTSDCYTVVLFTKAKIEKPSAEVPDAYSRFLGEWGGGAWNDVWCHDLRVTKVYPDGRADLFEMHAPYEPWGQPATAFRRTARIDEDGNLRFAYGTETLSYRIVNGKLEGKRSGTLGNLTVSLVHRGTPPIPIPRANRGDTAVTMAIPVSAPQAPAPQIAVPIPAAPRPAATSFEPPATGTPRLSPIPPPRPLRLVAAQPAPQSGG